jgi:beta-lactamase superfamily II metal-dependent hydrolase
MNLNKGRSYFISVSDAVLRAEAKHKSKAKNHLLFGDWLSYLGEEKGSWASVRCRGDRGWLPKSSFSEKRILEVNFLDIGQGDGCHIVTPDDKVILIDAGIGDNMFRFINWRYNLRGRTVAGVDGIPADAKAKPFTIDHVIISHPDKDHYYGFQELFDCKKLIMQNVYHNGIVERPIAEADKDPDLKYYSGDDLGGYAKNDDGEYVLWDVVTSNTAMQQLIKKHKTSRMQYLTTLRKAMENNKDVQFTALSADDDYVAGFGEGENIELKLLGPLTEKVKHGTKFKNGLRKLGSEGVTKNGHSVILQLRIGKLKVMLGGDLNTEAEDYLLKHYAQTTAEASNLEGRVYEIRAKGATATAKEKQELAEAETELQHMITKGRGHFQADITKACHHGSHHFSETFLQVLNSIVTVISSGDEESYAHPRPDALGSFGKYGRGVRPLIFSTELARSTKEFTPIYQYYEELKAYEAEIAAADTASEKKAIEKEMQERKDKNVVVYGMITLRTDGERVVLAQKLEIPGGNDNKWDIHELRYNNNLGEFEYVMATK